MTSNIQISQQQIQALFDDGDSPKGVLLASKLAQHYRDTLDPKASAIFKRADTALLAWWPSCLPPLLTIYEQEFSDCWSYYNELDSKDNALLELIESLLNCLYVALKILQVFERQLPSQRKFLPNDVNDIESTLLFDLYQSVIKNQNTQQQQALNNWIAQLAIQNWSQAIQSI